MMVQIMSFAFIMANIHISTAPNVNQASNCGGYTYPVGCTKNVNCLFEASWHVFNIGPPPSTPNSNNTLAASFTITIRKSTEKASNFYTAIGFSDQPVMPDSDAVIGYAYNNNFLEVVDAYVEPGRIKAPVVDQQQNIFNASGSLVDDPNDRTNRVLTYSFARPLDTQDSAQDVSLTNCRYFFFMTSGGAVSGPKQFHKHETTPIISSDKICLAKCFDGKNGSNGSSVQRVSSPIVVITFIFFLLF